MIKIDDKEYRNIQEQVQKNKEDIEKGLTGIVISYSVLDTTALAELITEANVGKYVYLSIPKRLYVITKRANEVFAENLGNYPAGTQGPQGETGPQGQTGQKGPGIYGTYSSIVGLNPSDFNAGDFVLLNDGKLYKVVNNQFVLQTSLKGPQGTQGDSGSVHPNPSTTASFELFTIEINGITYNVMSDAVRTWIDSIKDYVVQNGTTTEIGGNVEVDGNLEVNTNIKCDRCNIYKAGTWAGSIFGDTGYGLFIMGDGSLILNNNSAHQAYLKLFNGKVSYKDEGMTSYKDISDFEQKWVVAQGSSGTFGEAALAALQNYKNTKIVSDDNEIFTLSDNQETSGYLVYTHVGQDSTNNYYIKCITVTISTRGWVKTTKGLNLEDIKDNDGHDRFIEGALTTNAIPGVTYSYARWSLSGTHLMIVIAGSITNGTTIPGYQQFGSFDFSEKDRWIINKVFPIISSYVAIEDKTFQKADYSQSSITVTLIKGASGLSIGNFYSSRTLDNDATFRFEFDILIDNA